MPDSATPMAIRGSCRNSRLILGLDLQLDARCQAISPLENREHLVHLACFMPFDKVAQMMEEIVSVQTNEETVRRLTEQVGSWPAPS
jgi:hypothetical protein